MNKAGKIIFCFIPFVVSLVIQGVISIIGIVGYVITLFPKLNITQETDLSRLTEELMSSINAEFLLILTIIIDVVIIILFGIWYFKGFSEYREPKWKEAFTVKRVTMIVVLAIGVQFGMSILLGGISSVKPEWFEQYSKLIEMFSIGETWYSFLLIVIIAPIAEEILFRGVTLRYAKRAAMPFVAANILQAALFGIYHMNIIQGLYAFIFGLFLGLVYEKYRSIYAAILLHMVINLLGYLSGVFIPDDSMINLSISSFLILIASLLLIVFSTRMVYKEKIDNLS